MERVELIRQQFNVNVTYYKLRMFYLKNGVKFRNTQMVYRNHLTTKKEKDIERIDFIKRMLSFIMDNQPYIYFDEMALNSFMYKSKAWSFSDAPIEVPVNSGSRLKLSVYGAIGNVFDLPILSYYYNCTNGTDSLEFL